MNKETKAGTEPDSSTKADVTSVRQPCTKPTVSGSGFRVVELDGVFKIERKFKKVTETGCLWWIKKVEEYVWKNITTYGGECFRIPMYGTGIIIDTYKYKMEEFNTIEDAEKALDKLLNPPQPVYHYR